jgi:TonB family protein
MTIYLLQASACMIVFYGLYFTFYSRLTFFGHNRGYLLGSLMVSLIIPWAAPYLTLPLENPPVVHWQYIYSDEAVATLQESPTIHMETLFMSLAYVIYGLGVLLVFSKMAYGLFKIYTYYKNGQKKTIHHVPFVETDAVHLPFSFMNKVFVSRHVPLSKDIATILDHEVVHIRQWHSIDIILTEMVHAFFWFNPIVVLYKKSLKQAHEFLADKVVAEKVSPSYYSQLLLSQKQRGLELALTHSFFNSLIKKRIDMMTHHKSPQKAMWTYSGIVPVIALLFFFFSSCEVKEEMPPPPPAPPQAPLQPPTPTSDQEVFKVVEEMPRFPGCEDISHMDERKKCADMKMLSYISENLKYPESARKKGIEGTVVVQFVVNPDGSISDINIVRDIGEGCGQVAADIISQMNQMESKWIPGKQGGEKVKVMFTLPFRFKL